MPEVILPCSSVPLQSEPSQLVIENHAAQQVWNTEVPLPEWSGSASSSRRANACNLSNSSPVPVTSTGSVRVGCRDSRQRLPWGLGPFGGIGPSDRSHAGLPPQHLPFSEFLTLPTVSSHLNFVVVFHTTSTHRILGLQSFPLSASRSTFQRPLLSCCWTSSGVNQETRLTLCRRLRPLLRSPLKSPYPSNLQLRYPAVQDQHRSSCLCGEPRWQP